MLVPSGILFSVGGTTYATRGSDPLPGVFAYHEIFHALQVAATAAIYTLWPCTSSGRKGIVSVLRPVNPARGTAALDVPRKPSVVRCTRAGG